MHNIGENEITNMGGDFNYINCNCITEMNDATEVTLTLDINTGKYYLEGVSTQNGTPTPDNPIEIVNTYKAGHYKTTIGGNTYKFNLGDDLRSIGTYKDKFELDTTNNTALVTRNIISKTLNGTESGLNIMTASDTNYAYAYISAFDSIIKLDVINKFNSNMFDIIASLVRGTQVTTDTLGSADDISFSSKVRMFIKISRLGSATKEKLINWLSTNKPIINFILETPITESVEVD